MKQECYNQAQDGEDEVARLRRHQDWLRQAGRDLRLLLKGLSQQVVIPEELRDLAKSLDRHYVAPRYPDAFPEGAPSDYYTKTMAEEAVHAAQEVVAFVRGQIPNA